MVIYDASWCFNVYDESMRGLCWVDNLDSFGFILRDVLFRMVILCPKNCWVMLGDFLFVWWMFILMGGFERFFLKEMCCLLPEKR